MFSIGKMSPAAAAAAAAITADALNIVTVMSANISLRLYSAF